MAIEIERKFLVNKERWNKQNKGNGIFYRQGYILTDPAKTIRVRVGAGKGFLTIKGASVGAARPEYEYEIPVSDALEIMDKFCDADVSKTRYKINYRGKIWEVDEFSGNNEGLILAEIELEDESETFDLPDWIGEEVTEQEQYYNSNLSVKPFKSW